MKYALLPLLLLLCLTTSAQYYNTYFQLESSSAGTPNINSQIELTNGQTLMAIDIADSVSLSPPLNNFYNPNSTVQGAAILSVSPSKTISWHKEWTPTGNNFGNDFFTCYKIEIGHLGNIYMIGSFRGTVDLDPGPNSAMVSTSAFNTGGFLIKLDSLGNLIWSKTFLSATNNNFSGIIPQHAFLTPNGTLKIAGIFNGDIDFDPNAGIYTLMPSGLIEYSNFFLSLDTAGNLINISNTNITSTNDPSQKIVDMAQDVDGNYYVSYTYYDSLDIDLSANTKYYTTGPVYQNCIVKYDSALQIIWDKAMPSLYKNTLFSLTPTGHFYLFTVFNGPTLSNNNLPLVTNGGDDIVYEKWDTAGNCLWTKTMGGPGADYISECIEYNNELYLLYLYADSINTNTGSNDVQLNAIKTDIALSRLDLAGNHIRTDEIKSDSVVFLRSHNLNLTGNLIKIWFSNRGNTDVDPDPLVTKIVNPIWNTFRPAAEVIWSDLPLSIKENSRKKQLKIYPNPTSGKMIIELDNNYTISIYTSLGKLIKMQKGTAGINTLVLNDLTNGTYFINCRNEEKTFSAKMIIYK